MPNRPCALVAEDHQELCKVYQRLLSKHFKVDIAASISEMRRKISELGKPYDLLLVDLLLSDGNVLDVPMDDPLFTELRTCATIVVSETDDLEVLATTNKWARDYVTKPFNNNELVYRCLRFARYPSPELCRREMVLRYRGRTSEHLTMTDAKLFEVLASAGDRGMAKRSISQAIYQNSNRVSQVEVSLSRLRRKLAAVGFTVATVSELPHNVRLTLLPTDYHSSSSDRDEMR
jgi:DNA-binding response OmpR family regulator